MPRIMRSVLTVLKILWASPYTLLGIAIGLIGMCTGGKGRFRDGALEFFGGGTRWIVRHSPLGVQTQGITLGHTILGQTGEGLDECAYHERVHVRQFERWGFLMGPAYLLSSLWMWMTGRDIYRDNPFEVEAYTADEQRY